MLADELFNSDSNGSELNGLNFLGGGLLPVNQTIESTDVENQVDTIRADTSKRPESYQLDEQ